MAALFVLGALVPAQSQTGEPLAACPTVRAHNHYARYVLRTHVGGHGGDFHGSQPTGSQLAKLGRMRACMKHQDRAKYRLMRGAWTKRATKNRLYRHLDAITIHGEWAVPEYIIIAESGHSYTAHNAGGCGGPGCWGAYQIGEDHWGRACAGLGHDAAGQHECAYAILHGRGRYPAEGIGAWSTA